MTSIILGRGAVKPTREAIEWVAGGLPYIGSLIVELDDDSWYVQVVKIAGADHYLMEHRASDAGRHVWAIARSRDDLVRALMGFAERDETWITGFSWEVLEFDENTGCAYLPSHHPMSSRSGLTIEGFEGLPVLSDEEHEGFADDWDY
ncbi:hypothetical protein [Nonomuraea dietziae]|uniref:hypothetical protein n=1 Tax=Nonomuraea dietziae TaxID=65515 RepID=UPI0034038CB1